MNYPAASSGVSRPESKKLFAASRGELDPKRLNDREVSNEKRTDKERESICSLS